MSARLGYQLSLARKLMLAAAVTLPVATPFLTGFANAPPNQAQSAKVDRTPRFFETASIRVSKSSPAGRGPSVTSAPPALAVKHASLQALIRMAYQVKDFQISGGPAWINSDEYDIDAKADGNPTPKDWLRTMGQMLQGLLADRFKLKLHRETQQLPVYALIVAEGGPRMHPSKKGSCTPFDWKSAPPERGQWPSNYCGSLERGLNTQLNHTWDALGISITGVPGNAFPESLTTLFGNHLDRLVIDRTGLTGLFDLHLEWNLEATAKLMGPGAADDPNKAALPADPTNPSLFTAVRNQLGLKLESEKGSVEVLVIERAQKPSLNF